MAATMSSASSLASPPPETSNLPTPNYERHLSSTILEEEFLEKIEHETVRYVEVPEIVEVPLYVTKKSVVEVEKRVPIYEYEYVDKIVEVPEVQYVDKIVEVQQIQEIVRHIPKVEVVTVNKEIIRHVPIVETKIVEKVIEVPGDIVEVPKPYTVETKVIVPQYVDNQTAVVIAQSMHPFLQDSPDDVLDIDVVEYAPQVVEVEVQVPKPVTARVWSSGEGNSYHRLVKDMPQAHFNTLLQMLNPHLTTSQEKECLPFLRDSDGTIAMLNQNDVRYTAVPPNAKFVEIIEGELTAVPGPGEIVAEMTKIVAREVSAVRSAGRHSAHHSSTSSSSSSSSSDEHEIIKHVVEAREASRQRSRLSRHSRQRSYAESKRSSRAKKSSAVRSRNVSAVSSVKPSKRDSQVTGGHVSVKNRSAANSQSAYRGDRSSRMITATNTVHSHSAYPGDRSSRMATATKKQRACGC